MFSSIQDLSEKLEAAKYVTDPVTLKVPGAQLGIVC